MLSAALMIGALRIKNRSPLTREMTELLPVTYTFWLIKYFTISKYASVSQSVLVNSSVPNFWSLLWNFILAHFLNQFFFAIFPTIYQAEVNE